MLSSVSRGLRLLASKTSSNSNKSAAVLFASRHQSTNSKVADGVPQKVVEDDTAPVEISQTDYIDVSKVELGKTADEPVLVPAITSRTIVGCKCQEFSKTINWFYLDEGDPQMCDCGIYFQLKRVTEDSTVPEIYKVMSIDEDILKNCARRQPAFKRLSQNKSTSSS